MQSAKLLARSSQRQRIRYVLDHAAVHLDEPLCLAKAAEIAGLEHTYFSKLFRKVTGRKFVDWNRMRRIEQAKILLRESDLSVVSVGLAVGYSDVTTFCRAFRRAEGAAPRQYRAICQGRSPAASPPGERPRPPLRRTAPQRQETPRQVITGLLD
jgi:AraC-like DNA-binding protein